MAIATNPELVRYGNPSAAAAQFQRSMPVHASVDVAVAQLCDSIRQAGLWVLHEIDPQALLKRGGYDIGQARQLLFFHPRYMVRILSADPSALLEAPLKLALLETQDQGTLVRWCDPAPSFARYGNSDLAQLGRELASLCETVAGRLVAGK